jgi:hypothetical protein
MKTIQGELSRDPNNNMDNPLTLHQQTTIV